MTHRSVLAALAAALALAACDGGTDSPPGGEYRAVLESPHKEEGALAVELTGPGIESISADAGSLFTQPSGASTRVVVIREPAGRIEFRVTMAAGQQPPAARIIEVVDEEDRPRESLDGYRLDFRR
ncbi:MAG TPA: hypothetical protein VGX50_04895 [Longimicrobium sp.]|nr:hypothetical protein [Longimicrobium sp.]